MVFDILWRCEQGRVLACAQVSAYDCQFLRASDTPTFEMRQFCRAYPNGGIPYAITGRDVTFEWTCRGGVPLAGRQLVQAGFRRKEWKDVTVHAPSMSVATSRRLLPDVETRALVDTKVYSGPGASYPFSFILHRGETARADSAVGAWCMINSADAQFTPCASLAPPPGGWHVGKTVKQSCWPKCGD